MTDTLQNGVFSWPKRLTLQNYREAWRVGEVWDHFLNTMFITVPEPMSPVALLLLAAGGFLRRYTCAR